MKKKLLLSAIVLGSLTLSGCGNSDDNDSKSEPKAEVVNRDIGGGQILIYKTDGTFIDAAHVGHLPDMVKFVDTHTLVVANEGEPSSDYTNDPEGSISIVELSNDHKVQTVSNLGFAGVALGGDVRIKPNTVQEKDLEPEYVAVSSDGKTAWVSLQENNAVAIVDIENKTISAVKGLGKVALSEVDMDILDDGEANPVLTDIDNIFALRMPDTMVAYNVGGQDFFVTANEGDDREYDGYEDYSKASDLEDDNEQSLLSQSLQGLLETKAKKLRVLNDLGQNSDNVYESLYLAGTRSFSIFDASGAVVFDSGSDFEKTIARDYAGVFNTRVDDVDYVKPESEDYAGSDYEELVDDEIPHEVIGDKAYFWEGVDARSLKKGVEPEALAVHKIGDKVFAYIGLEKQGGFFIYDVTSPTQTQMVDYFNDIDYTQLPSKAGDLAPEGMVAFAQDGKHYLAVAHELSSTLALFELASDGTATKLTSVTLGSFDKGAAEIVDYSSQDKKLYVTNAETKTVDIVNVANPAQAAKEGSVDFSQYADDLQSVSVKDGLLAIAVKRR